MVCICNFPVTSRRLSPKLPTGKFRVKLGIMVFGLYRHCVLCNVYLVTVMTVNNVLLTVVRECSREDGEMEGKTFAVAEKPKLCIATDTVYSTHSRMMYCIVIMTTASDRA